MRQKKHSYFLVSRPMALFIYYCERYPNQKLKKNKNEKVVLCWICVLSFHCSGKRIKR